MAGCRTVATCLVAGASIFAIAQTEAVAQARSFKLMAGSANHTLPAFGMQSGIEIIAPADHLDGVRTNSVVGLVDARAALRTLLQGTGLEIASDQGATIILRRSVQKTPTKIAYAAARPVAMAPSGPAPAFVEDAAPPAPEPAEIVVIGSQIKGAKTTGALPVSVVGKDDIAALGAQSANDLFRSLPQASDATFNEQFLGTATGGGSPNASRGDMASVSLRGLEQGNTLVLLNGRRMVLHPTSQTSGGVPVLTFNVNAIPVGASSASKCCAMAPQPSTAPTRSPAS